MDEPFDKKPFNGLAGLKAHWKDDLLSGFMVSLIALPLCLGIALASGVPPMAGLITAIVGGMFMSRITGSHVTISGPAAGLIVVTLSAVESMGGGDPIAGYKYALAAIVLAGLIQVGFGMLKVGKFGDFFPYAAVHGMLAAIGVIIMVKQLFVALGTKSEGDGLIEVIGEIPQAFLTMNPEIALIAFVSLLILVIHPLVNLKVIKMVPAPMWVILVTIPLSHLFGLFEQHPYSLIGNEYVVGPNYLVQLPNNVIDGIVFPDFGMIGKGVFWVSVFSIALVSSIESLLSAAAVDTLDPYQRKSNLNTDVAAMGGGSAISGFLGGLPMISEIVRSSANISNGAKTQWANFFHGTFLLLFLLFGKPIIEQIPLAALAAMLIHVGFRLAAPKEFIHMREIGKAQLVIFVSTLVMVLATDLIIGIAFGILVKFIIHLIYGAPIKYLFKSHFEYEESTSKKGVIHLHDAAIFSNYLSLKHEINNHHDKEHLVIDFQDVNLIDHTFTTHLHELMEDWKKEGKDIDLQNISHLIPVSNHPLAARVANREMKEPSDLKQLLNIHQQMLQKVAEANHWKFEGKKTLSVEVFRNFTFSRAAKISYAHNLISGNYSGFKFFFAEIIYDQDALTKSSDSVLPALVLQKEDNTTYPVFTLEKEGLIDKIKDSIQGTDINFIENSKFSKKFLLRGENESAVRQLFSDALLRLTLEESEYHVESNGKSLIIYRFNPKNREKYVPELIEFGKKLVHVITD